MNNDRDDDVGYGKPPKKSQFKKGQSGCPNGGHEQRRKNKAKLKKQANESEKKRVKEIENTARKVMMRERSVMTSTGPKQMSNFEIAFQKFAERCNRDDATTRDYALYFKLADKLKLIQEPPPEGAKTMVLVVNQIQSIDDWAKSTEGELLPKNPLHGIPGIEDALETPVKRGRRSFGDDED